VPEGPRDVTIYLHPEGAAKFIGFLKEAFAAEEFVRYDSPEGDVLHAKIRIGDSALAGLENSCPQGNLLY
jgi:PhnB protein